MSISKQQLNEAVLANIITEEQAQQLAAMSESQTVQLPQFTLTHSLYYSGGCLAIAAMSLLMSLSWEAFGGAGIVLLAIVFMGVGLKAIQILGSKKLFIPMAICATFVVSLTPVAVYGLLQWLRVWPEELSSYYPSVYMLALELSTLAVGVIMLRFVAASLTTLPVVLSLLSLAWHVFVYILGEDAAGQSEQWIAIGVGLLLLVGTVLVNLRFKKTVDYYFWAYLVGAIMLWVGFTDLLISNDIPKALYFVLNLAMVTIGVLLTRRIFVVLGVLGCISYLSYLAFDVFLGSWLFVVALTAIGFGIIFLGVWWQKCGKEISEKLRLVIPDTLQ